MRVQQWWQRQRCRCILSASLLGLLGGVIPAWATSTVITALQEAVVEGSTIHLGDVARVQSDDADLVRRLQRVALGHTPPIGVTRLLSRSTMLLQLRHEGMAGLRLEFRGARQVRVSLAAQRLHLSELEATVRQTISPRLQQTAPGMTIRDIRGLVSVSVPPGPVHYEVLTPSQVPRTGTLTFTLTIQVAGKVERQLTGTVSLSLPQEAAGKTPVGAAATAVRHAVSAPRTAARNDLAHKPLARPPASNTPPIVRRGDLLQIVSETALIKVSTPGEALESGRVGDTIRVKNIASNRALKAQVIDQQTVRVLL